jgi:hypothetical protein
MGRLFRIAAVALVVTASTVSAAPGVRLAFSDGCVWIAADGATVGQILAEWERAGGTHIVNGDIASQPLTLEMSGVPEMQALDVVLRSAGGFIATARTAEQAAGANVSRFSQITVLAPGRAPAIAVRPTGTDPPQPIVPPAFTPPPIFAASGARRVIGPDGQPVPDDQEGAPAPPPVIIGAPPAAPLPPASTPAVTQGATTPGGMPAQPKGRR